MEDTLPDAAARSATPRAAVQRSTTGRRSSISRCSSASAGRAASQALVSHRSLHRRTYADASSATCARCSTRPSRTRTRACRRDRAAARRRAGAARGVERDGSRRRHAGARSSSCSRRRPHACPRVRQWSRRVRARRRRGASRGRRCSRYAELNARANQLAAHLRDDRARCAACLVGLLLDRSADAIVGTVGHPEIRRGVHAALGRCAGGATRGADHRERRDGRRDVAALAERLPPT